MLQSFCYFTLKRWLIEKRRYGKITFVHFVKPREFSKHRELMAHESNPRPPFSAEITLDRPPMGFGTSLAFDT